MNAPDKAKEIKAVVTAVIAFFTTLWGWLGWMVVLLAVCMLADYLTGSWAARSRGEWSSSIARAGRWHKLGEIVALFASAMCDIAVGTVLKEGAFKLPFEIGNVCFMTPVVTLWYILTELGSIVENAGELGAPIPKRLARMIKSLSGKVDSGGGSESEDSGKAS